VGNLAIQIAKLGGDGHVGVDLSEAANWVRSRGGLGGRRAARASVKVGVVATVEDLTNPVIAGNTVVSSTKLVVSDGVNVGSTDSTKGLGELRIDGTGSFEEHGVENVLWGSNLGHVISGHLLSARLGGTRSVTRGVEGGLGASVLERPAIGDSGVAEAKSKGHEVVHGGVEEGVVARVFANLGPVVDEQGDGILVDDNVLVLSNVDLTSLLEDHFVVPPRLLELNFASQAVVVAEEKTLNDLQTIVLSTTRITGSKVAVGNVDSAGREALGRDGNGGRFGVGINVDHQRHPVGEVTNLVWGNIGVGVGVDGVVEVVLGNQKTINVGTKKVGNSVVLAIHDVKVKERGGVGSNLELAVNHFSTRAKDTSVVLSERRDERVKSIIGLFDGNENVVLRSLNTNF